VLWFWVWNREVSALNSYWFCDGLKVIWGLNLACYVLVSKVKQREFRAQSYCTRTGKKAACTWEGVWAEILVFFMEIIHPCILYIAILKGWDQASKKTLQGLDLSQIIPQIRSPNPIGHYSTSLGNDYMISIKI